MKFSRLFLSEKVDLPCKVSVNNTFESLEAHVELAGDLAIEPGDTVLVHGDPVRVPYGESLTVHRQATVTRASAIERAWTRMTGDLEFMELCEFSFSGEKL